VSDIEEMSRFYEDPLVTVLQPSLMHEDDRNIAVDTQEEENNFEEVKKKLKLANIEISQLKKRARKHAIKKANFKRIKAMWDDGKVPKLEVVGRDAQYFTCTVHAIKEAMYIRMINERLRTNIRVMKGQIED